MAISGIVDGFALYTTNGRYLTPSESPISITVARSLVLLEQQTHTVFGPFALIVLVGRN
jgi:hypothetical protein